MNFYNEHDPKAAAWLRELIAAKLIPDGIVDERSITEIKSHELTHYTQCHFFAGIGGWSLALALAGWPATRPVWTGSCPCQPFSNAGKGLAQADERHLWPAFFNLIRECRPGCVIGEQVESAIGKGWLDGIQTDLEGEGYALGSVVLGAHSLGAPHIRQRLFWVADSAGGQRQQRLRPQGHELQRSADDCADGRLGDALIGGQRGRDERGLGAAGQQVGEPENGARAANEPRDGREDAGGLADVLSEGQQGRLRGREDAGREDQHGHAGRGGRAGGMGHPDILDGEQLRGHSGEGEEQPVECQQNPWADFDIIPCRDGKARRIESGTFPLVNGIPGGVVPGSDPSVSEAQATAESRVARLRGYGNAIVPQVAAEFVIAYLEIESEA